MQWLGHSRRNALIQFRKSLTGKRWQRHREELWEIRWGLLKRMDRRGRKDRRQAPGPGSDRIPPLKGPRARRARERGEGGARRGELLHIAGAGVDTHVRQSGTRRCGWPPSFSVRGCLGRRGRRPGLLSSYCHCIHGLKEKRPRWWRLV